MRGFAIMSDYAIMSGFPILIGFAILSNFIILSRCTWPSGSEPVFNTVWSFVLSLGHFSAGNRALSILWGARHCTASDTAQWKRLNCARNHVQHWHPFSSVFLIGRALRVLYNTRAKVWWHAEILQWVAKPACLWVLLRHSKLINNHVRLVLAKVVYGWVVHYCVCGRVDCWLW